MDPQKHGDPEGVPDMSISRTTREELAMDHALGLSEGAEQERAERLAQTDTEFAGLLRYWRERMGELDRTAPERTAVALKWDTIEQALDAQDSVQQRPVASPSQPGLLTGIWESLGFWRPAGLAAGFAALILAFGLGQQLLRPPTQPVYVAVLQTGDGRAAAVVNAFADGTVTLVPLETIGVPEGRILEVWTLQTRERGPVSIGRMDRARSLKLDLKSLSRPDSGHLFEITVEPQGGSPTGRPTGPILMKGLASTAL
jgi:anti-sigma-K factor RskA